MHPDRNWKLKIETATAFLLTMFVLFAFALCSTPARAAEFEAGHAQDINYWCKDADASRLIARAAEEGPRAKVAAGYQAGVASGRCIFTPPPYVNTGKLVRLVDEYVDWEGDAFQLWEVLDTRSPTTGFVLLWLSDPVPEPVQKPSPSVDRISGPQASARTRSKPIV